MAPTHNGHELLYQFRSRFVKGFPKFPAEKARRDGSRPTGRRRKAGSLRLRVWPFARYTGASCDDSRWITRSTTTYMTATKARKIKVERVVPTRAQAS